MTSHLEVVSARGGSHHAIASHKRQPTRVLSSYSLQMRMTPHLEVVSAGGANQDAISHVKGVHHKEVDDGFQQVLQSVAEAEGEGQHQCGARQPRLVQVHLYGRQALSVCSVSC